jgi:hypothetical protein
MPTTDGIEFLGTVRRELADRPWLQLLLVTGQASLETAVAAMRLDASDYLFKPIEPKSLREAVQHALTRAESIRLVRHTSGDSPVAHELQQIADTAKAMAADMRRTIEDTGRRDNGSPASAVRRGQQPAHTETAATAAGGALQHLRRSRHARARLGNARRTHEGSPRQPASLRHQPGVVFEEPDDHGVASHRGPDPGGSAARVPDPADRRRTYVELTAEGMARMQLFLEGFARTALGST